MKLVLAFLLGAGCTAAMPQNGERLDRRGRDRVKLPEGVSKKDIMDKGIDFDVLQKLGTINVDSQYNYGNGLDSGSLGGMSSLASSNYEDMLFARKTWAGAVNKATMMGSGDYGYKFDEASDWFAKWADEVARGVDDEAVKRYLKGCRPDSGWTRQTFMGALLEMFRVKLGDAAYQDEFSIWPYRGGAWISDLLEDEEDGPWED